MHTTNQKYVHKNFSVTLRTLFTRVEVVSSLWQNWFNFIRIKLFKQEAKNKEESHSTPPAQVTVFPPVVRCAQNVF